MEEKALNLSKAIDSDFNKNISEFPYEIFPKAIQNLIDNASETIGYNKEYLSAGILSVCATAIGNRTKIFNGSFPSKPILWISIIGRSGIGKTHPLNFAKKPLEDKDSCAYNDFKKALQEYELQESKNNRPKYSSIILKDFTPEKLAENLQHNKKGVLIFRDELIGWINSFDQYKKGGDQQLYLELFNGSIFTNDRVSKDPNRVEEANVNIIGGLQPKMLKNLAGNSRDEDGFLARFLFIYPKNLKPNLFTGKCIEKKHVINYTKLINNLFDSPARDLKATKSTVELYIAWQHLKAKEFHNDDLESSIQSKLETYVWRLALIIECMSQAAIGSYSSNISDKSLIDAISLIEYFRLNTYKVYDSMLVSNPLEDLPVNKLDLYKALPLEFKRLEVLPLFEQYQVKGGSINRFLKSSLFTSPKYGAYKKKYN